MNQVWNDELQNQLIHDFGDTKGALLANKYANTFSTSYIEECSISVALADIKIMEKLSNQHPLDISFYRSEDKNLHLRLFQYDNPIPLSDTLPMFENMDIRTMDERPYRVILNSEPSVWISDFSVIYTRSMDLVIDSVKENFQNAFVDIRLGLCENDGFNKLILGAGLAWQEIVILRAYAKYLRQTGFRFSQAYIELALVNNADITRDLILLFKMKYNPSKKDLDKLAGLEDKILQALEKVISLDEDKIVRRILQLIKATLRTNYYQTDENGEPKSYLSFKLSSQDVPELPLPVPLYEIFVYSPVFEGIHLRNDKVARGGIRWSDRREDFRTEILGLMKAQKVKNAVIVPSGAKGGFVLKALPLNVSREMIQAEVVTCYQNFICGLLDLTDNLIDEKVIEPPQLVCYDEEDTYLVVAADKGTATFSDLANAISRKYNFWLGDAFASGGSVGYDHKKMGITARGSWESIKRHFHELEVDVMTTDFTVVGIGDMSGDVFGNGMMYTPHIKLLAAFDHRDIFIDPSPNPKAAFEERVRLFQLTTSSWKDYNPSLISAGGGVFSRSVKSVPLSPEMKRILQIDEDALAPMELIRAILKAPVDLLYNGGIGTYVKASTESHADVGDKTNEFCRINGNELRARVVGEGGNLGFTQLGRIEFALERGLINTDFIDNSAGVDCSDHEVNIKILLNQEVAKQNITEEKRNTILASMTQEVAGLVLKDNFNQALVMSYANFYAVPNIIVHKNYIKSLEASGVINREVEFLPDDKRLLERKAASQGLTRPELAILLAYTKIHIKNEILSSDIPSHPYLSRILETAFPASLKDRYQDEMMHHSLHREIVATQLSNQIVNEMGIIFVYNLQTETGATVPEILRAYTVASRVFAGAALQKLIQSLEFKVPLSTQYELISHIRHLVNLATRWFIRHHKLKDENMEEIIIKFSEGATELQPLIVDLMGGATKVYMDNLVEQFKRAGVSPEMAPTIAVSRAMYTSLNIIDVASDNDFDLIKTAKLYFEVGEKFHLLWFRDRIASDVREGYWDTLARLTLRDELDVLQKLITVAIMKHSETEGDMQKFITQWIDTHRRSMLRWEKILEMLHSSTSIDYVMFFIALRELSDLIHASEVV